MSNPGVILLSSKKNIGPNIQRFDVEDNIGESIHIHINNFRFDFTIKEFLKFANEINKAKENLEKYKGFNISMLDKYFLFRLSPRLSDITSVYYKKILLKDLRCYQKYYFLGLPFWIKKKIINTPHYKYLINKRNKFSHYKQDNYLTISNKSRMEKLKNSFNTKQNFDPLVIFHGEYIIRDGLHRAAILRFMKNDFYAVNCMVIKFKKFSKFKNSFVFTINILIKILNKLKAYYL